MNKLLNSLLKIFFAIEFILILSIIALSSINNKELPTAFVVKESPRINETDFKVFTKAVCEEKTNEVFCHDELFIKCDDKEIMILKNESKNFIVCKDIKIKLSDIVNGSVNFKRTQYLNIS